MVVSDVTTGDVLFEWPYVMTFAWGVTDRTFVAAISGAFAVLALVPYYAACMFCCC